MPEQVITNQPFSHHTIYEEAGRTLAASNAPLQPAVAPTSVDLGDYMLGWSAANSNGTQILNSRLGRVSLYSLLSGGGVWMVQQRYNCRYFTSLDVATNILNETRSVTLEAFAYVEFIDYDQNAADNDLHKPDLFLTFPAGYSAYTAVRAVGQIYVVREGIISFAAACKSVLRVNFATPAVVRAIVNRCCKRTSGNPP